MPTLTSRNTCRWPLNSFMPNTRYLSFIKIIHLPCKLDHMSLKDTVHLLERRPIVHVKGQGARRHVAASFGASAASVIFDTLLSS